ncbi:hypothetical protein CCR75_004771 [Bremia lactucae]|uniref:Uncharacterized protein n=1 Tax=Bremia lactucae TaxID=4779 RepID=A0A976FNU6_BRELC|nr:hypothetical protein CCR75_004771 [Bremia lactucae]
MANWSEKIKKNDQASNPRLRSWPVAVHFNSPRVSQLDYHELFSCPHVMAKLSSVACFRLIPLDT